MNKKHLRVIKDIQDRIPKELLQRLMKKEIQAPAIKKTMEVALTKPDSEISPRQKRRIRVMLDSGMLDQEVEVLDLEVEKQISDFVAAEIDLAVKLGRLPKEAPKLKLLNNKGTQYARRQAKRLRAEFIGEYSDVVSDPKDDQGGEEADQTRPDNGGVLHETGSGAGGQGLARQD